MDGIYDKDPDAPEPSTGRSIYDQDPNAPEKTPAPSNVSPGQDPNAPLSPYVLQYYLQSPNAQSSQPDGNHLGNMTPPACPANAGGQVTVVGNGSVRIGNTTYGPGVNNPTNCRR